MARYNVKVQRYLCYEVPVDSEDPQEAERIVQDQLDKDSDYFFYVREG